ncbi:hypothetical protein BH11PLA2_BH11PLA2_37550 [soil metagenome]
MIFRALVALAALFSTLGLVSAQNGTWTQNGIGTPYDWGTSSNWLSGSVADGTDSTALFSTAGLTAPMIINLDTNRTIGVLSFDNPTNAFGWTISSNTGSQLTLSTTTGLPVINVDSANLTAIINVAINGTQGFVKTGSGTVLLGQQNFYAGDTTVSTGTLGVDFTQGSVFNDILPTTTNLILGSGGSFSLTANATSVFQTLAGLGLNSGAANLTINLAGGAVSTLNLNTITRNPGSSINFIVPNSGSTINVSNSNVNGIIGGWAIYTNNTTGATGFASSNGASVIPLATYTPSVNAATFVAANNYDQTTNGVIAPAASANFNSIRFNNGGGTDYTLSLSGANTIVSGGILVTANMGAGAGAAITGGTLTSGTTDLVITQLSFYKSLTITSQITGGIGLTTAGIGTTVLAGVNTYTGQTVVGGGTLLASGTSSLPGYNIANTVFVQGGGTLAVSTSDLGPWLPADITTLKANATFNAGSALGFDIAVGNSLTFSPNLSGVLGVTKNNDGTLILTGSSNFTGVTTINGGILSAGTIANAGSPSAIGAGADLVFGTGGTFQYTGSNASVDRGILLKFNGGVINVTTAGTSLSLSGLVYGVGGLTKSGPGTLTISGTGNYSGPTLVTAGTLTFSGANSIPSGNNLTIFQGATVSIGAAATPTLAGLSGGGTLSLGSATQLNLGSDSGSGAFQGTITSTSVLALVKNGSGIQALIGGNTYTGGTTVNGGTLLLSPQTVSANPLGTGPVTLTTAGVSLAYRQLLPVPTTGYNRDVIYGVGEGSNSPFRSQADLKATIGFDIPNNQIYYSQGVSGPTNSTTGLPRNLAINSLVGGGSTFIMQPYNANNVLFLTAGSTSTLGIGSPGSFRSINLLTASTNGASAFTATLNFQDGTSTLVSGLSSPDWFNGTAGLAAGGTAPNGLDRYNFITNGFDNNTTNPRLYQVGITLSAADSLKVLTSVTLASQAAGSTAFGVFALNGTTSGAPATVSPGNAVLITAPGNTNLEVSGYTAVNFGNLTLDGSFGPNTVALTGTNGSFMNFTGTTFSANAPILNVATGVTMNLGVLTDSNTGIGFTKSGAGTLILASGTAYTGGAVAIQAGTLIAQSPSALPGFVTPGQITLSAGAALVAGFGGAGQFTQTDVTTLLGNVAFVSGSQFGLDVATGTSTYSSVIALPSGVGFVKTGNGILVVGNANTYTGATTISGGQLSAGNFGLGGFNSSVGASSAAAANLVFNNGALLLYSGPTGTTNRSFTLNAGTGTASGGGFNIPTGVILTLTGASTGGGIFYKAGAGTLLLTGANLSTGGITINGGTVQIGAGGSVGSVSNTGAIINNGTLTFFRSDAVTQTNAISGTGGLVKLGAGSLILSGINTYTGPTTVITGILQAGSTSAFGTGSAVTVASGTTLALNNNSNTIGSLSGAGTVSNNGTINAVLTLGDSTNTTFSGVIQNGSTGTLALIKTGTGTLTLTGPSTFTGGVTLLNGTIAVSTDAALGTGSFTNTPFGTLSFTASTTTSRSYNLGLGNLAIAGGTTLTLNGSQIGGGYIGGSGSVATNPANGAIFSGITTQPSTTLASNSSNDRYFNFSNGGAMTLAANLSTPIIASGFTNQGSGSVTVGANSGFNVENFQSYGVVTLNPGTSGFTQFKNTGTAQLFFNGGSRTFINSPSTVGSTAGIDLNGRNAVVAGGLFVNNGVVFDGTGGTATVIADFGALVRGAGFYVNPVITRNGGRFQAGNSPGVSNQGSVFFGNGGSDSITFQINNATGIAGPSADGNGQVSGWSLYKGVQLPIFPGSPINTSGNFTWAATPTQKLLITMQTLLNPTTVGTDNFGPMANFNAATAYQWALVQYTGTYTGPTDSLTLTNSTSFDFTGFSNSLNDGSFNISLDLGAKTMYINFVPSVIPEPGFLLVAGGLFGLACIRRRITA